jgi:hypothetical protein
MRAHGMGGGSFALALFALFMAGPLLILAVAALEPKPTLPERPIAEPQRPARAFAQAGEWVTTVDGQRVCRLVYGLGYGMVFGEGTCSDWQPGFRLVRGQTFPRSWTRPTGGGGLQFHVENRGWVP